MQHPSYTPDWATPCRESLPVTERAVLDLMSYVPWQVLAALFVIGLVTIATRIGLLTIWCCKTLRDAWNKYHRCARRKPANPPQPQGRPAPVPGTPPPPRRGKTSSCPRRTYPSRLRPCCRPSWHISDHQQLTPDDRTSPCDTFKKRPKSHAPEA